MSEKEINIVAIAVLKDLKINGVEEKNIKPILITALNKCNQLNK